MLLNAEGLKTVFTSLNTKFEQGLQDAPVDHMFMTEDVNSTSSEEEYPWLAQIGGMREWIGSREIGNLSDFVYRLKNKDYEKTLEIPTNAVEDDKWGGFGKTAEILGRLGAAHPCELMFAALRVGATTQCYDGQNFFDTQHPVKAANGAVQPISNYTAGGGNLWVLMCTTSYIKPLILQRRQQLRLTSKNQVTDDNVFFEKKLVYGIDDRKVAGYSLWQLVYGSTAPLTPDSYAAARLAMMSLTGDGGRPLGLIGDKLLVGPTNELAGRNAIVVERLANGADNPWAGTAELVVSPRMV